jgi:hypothetical protein
MKVPDHLTNAPKNSQLVAWLTRNDVASYSTPSGDRLVINGVIYADVAATQLVISFAHQSGSLRRRLISDYVRQAKPERSAP